ncbi:MAG: hypothetical protein F4X64_01300 [Chloroflexi bacterium]|nr:hypothetical protein [Chloroflexota bacterium]
MEGEALRQIRLVRDEDVEVLPESKPIGITATATTERRNGESVLRFAFREKDDHARELFRKLSPWHKFLEEFALEIDEEPLVKPCSLRECSFDPQTETLYISIYTPVSAEKVLDWF